MLGVFNDLDGQGSLQIPFIVNRHEFAGKIMEWLPVIS